VWLALRPESLSRGPEQVGERRRDGLRFEQALHKLSGALPEDLRDQPECRDPMPKLMKKHNAVRRADVPYPVPGRGEPPSAAAR
jgi:hypothetical protein